MSICLIEIYVTSQASIFRMAYIISRL